MQALPQFERALRWCLSATLEEVMSASATRILLCGLENTLAAELTTVLADHQVSQTNVRDQTALDQRLRTAPPDVVFCSSERRIFDAVMDAIRQSHRILPVIAVSRTPEVSEWLDAMDSGASDYCGAPFDTRSINWILESNLRRAVA